MKEEINCFLSYLDNRIDELKTRNSRSLERLVQIKDRFLLILKASEYYNSI